MNGRAPTPSIARISVARPTPASATRMEIEASVEHRSAIVPPMGEPAVEQPGRAQPREHHEADHEPRHGARDHRERRARSAPAAAPSAARHRRRGSVAARCRAAHQVAPSSTGRIARFRVSFTTVATSPAGRRERVAGRDDLGGVVHGQPGPRPERRVGQAERPADQRQQQHADEPEQGDRRDGVGRLPVAGAR